MFRAIHVVAPEKSLLNPIFPAAVGARAATGHYVPVVLFGALHALIPDRVMAAPGSPLWNLTLTGDRGGAEGRFTAVLFFNGGLGGRPGKDGVACLSWPSNISTTPVEVAERNGPVFFAHKRLSEGSGGDGQFRGGLGQDVEITLEAAGGTSAFLMVERTKIAAPGLGGGSEGALGRVLINGADVDPRVPHHLQAGDVIALTTPGGGGYGDPALRTPAARRRDAALGYVSGTWTAAGSYRALLTSSDTRSKMLPDRDRLRQHLARGQPVGRLLQPGQERLVLHRMNIVSPLLRDEGVADRIAVRARLLRQRLRLLRVPRGPFRLGDIGSVHRPHQAGILAGERLPHQERTEIDLEVQVPPFEENVVRLELAARDINLRAPHRPRIDLA
ncbi:MAG: hydantoinase B/oxoprolinase family protein [Acetobacteraceae bacterium]